MNAGEFDVVVIGGGPGGHKAAICAAKAGKSVAIVERDARIGGACVHRGTIPSKALREAAVEISRFVARAKELGVELPSELKFAHVRGHLDRVIDTHVGCLADQLARNGITRFHGHASFRDPFTIDVRSPAGLVRELQAGIVVIATGSRPRQPPGIDIDHEHVLDSDSVLGMEYLPASMTILGGGVIASEYASILATLGVAVTMVDRAERPLAFLDADLSHGFVAAFTAMGGRYLGGRTMRSVAIDGPGRTTTTLDDGTAIASEKVLVALGRLPATGALGLATAGIVVDKHGRIPVDANCRTAVQHVYAVGDVIGSPSLASCATDQGRRAMMHALGLGDATASGIVPVGIFTVPELASVGDTEAQVRERLGDAIVGVAKFSEIARGQIAGDTDGMLKLVADPTGERLLGVGIVGEGATELVHLGQLVLLGSGRVRELVDHVFNFPTLAEAYRVAALDVLGQARRRTHDHAA
ncbi:MAG TPA: Si-specific NAD(P)(+) transhydrogenase [Nannocystaceae bacterium]|nr:Si-specific NAD(P)(+) transhydrogenase [Nannocystaceae bacterium]